MSLSMSRDERERFLADVHVGVLTVAAPDGLGPLAVPVWYTYQPGGVVSVTTGSGSRKVAAIRAAGRCSLCAQQEHEPYKYVTIEGPAVVELGADLAERREIARRHMGTALALVGARRDAHDPLEVPGQVSPHELIRLCLGRPRQD